MSVIKLAVGAVFLVLPPFGKVEAQEVHKAPQTVLRRTAHHVLPVPIGRVIAIPGKDPWHDQLLQTIRPQGSQSLEGPGHRRHWSFFQPADGVARRLDQPLAEGACPVEKP